MKRKILTVILSITMIFSTTGYAFANVDLDNPPEEPTKPKVENYQDNDKIEKYNKEAEEYNKKADEYNAAVDEEYNNAKAEVDKQNTEGEAKQEASQKAHDEAVAANEAEQNRVDEANKKIDEDNAAEEQRIKEENAQKQAKYDADYEQYTKDKDLEKQILDAGYESVEQYNEAVTTYNQKVQKYNDSVTAYNTRYENEIQKCKDLTAASVGKGIESVTENEEDLPDAYDIDDNIAFTTNPKTIKVEPAAEPSGKKYKIMVQHIYRDGDLFVGKWEVIEADYNDVVTIVPEKVILTPDDLGSVATYNYTDEAHADGYWIPYIWFGSAAQTTNDISIPGDDYQGPIYQFSYKDGSIHATGDEKDITLIYEYSYWDYSWFTPYELRDFYDHANVPNEPILNLETFIPKEHEIPNFIGVPDVEVWEKLPDPVKREYLKRLILMSLFAVPSDNIDIIESDDNIVDNNEVIDDKDKDNNVKKTARSTNNASTYILEENTETADTIKYSPLPTAATPLVAPEQTGAWAFINLLTVLINFVLSIILLLMIYINNRKEDDETEVKNKILMRICTLIIAIISGIVFLFTEDMTLPMVLIDKWTPLMIIILIFNIIAAILSRRKIKEKEEIEKE